VVEYRVACLAELVHHVPCRASLPSAESEGSLVATTGTLRLSSSALIDPGVVLVNHWRPDAAAPAVPNEHVHLYGGVAVKR
jgi:hypothetical protein